MWKRLATLLFFLFLLIYPYTSGDYIGSIKLNGADAYLVVDSSSVSVNTPPQKLTDIYATGHDVTSLLNLIPTSIDTQKVELTKTYLTGHDRNAEVTLVPINIDTTKNPLTNIYITGYDAITIIPPSASSPPSASFTYTINGLTVHFTAMASDPDGSIVSYTWDFGDGTTGSGKIVTHTYSQPGTYTITLTVKDNDGLTAGVSKEITVVRPINTIKLVVGNIPVAFVDVEAWKDGKLVETATPDLDGIVHFTHEIDQSYTLKILGKEYGVNDVINLDDVSESLFGVALRLVNITPVVKDTVKFEIIRLKDGKRYTGFGSFTRITVFAVPQNEEFEVHITERGYPEVRFKFVSSPKLIKPDTYIGTGGLRGRFLYIELPYIQSSIDEQYFTDFDPFLDGYSFSNPSINAHVDWADWIRELLNLPTEGLCYGMSTTAELYYNYKVHNHYPKLILYQQGSFENDMPPLALYGSNKRWGDPVKEYGVLYYDNILFAILLHQEYQKHWYVLHSYDIILGPYPGKQTAFNHGIGEIKELFKNNVPININLWRSFPPVGHTILSFGMLKIGDTYYFAVYNPNDPLTYSWMEYKIWVDSSEVVHPTIKLLGEGYDTAEFTLPHSLKYSWFLVPFFEKLDYKSIMNYFQNYTLLVSSHQLSLTYTNSTGTYSGEFVDGKFYKSDIPYSAGFMEWSKENGNVEPFYAVIYPKKLDELGKVEVKTLTPPGDLDPYTVMTIEEDKITGFSVNSTINVVTINAGGGYVLEANGSGNIKISKFTITNNSYENTTLSFEGTNSKVYLDNASVRVDLNGDGTVDKTVTLPHAEFTFSPDTAGVNEPITFSASSAGGSAVSYVWDFGDGSTASGQVVTHSYSRPGTYVVTLTVTGEDGVSVSTSKTVVIQPMIFLVPPTPENNTVVDKSYVFVNMTSSESLESAFIEWNGERLRMESKSPTNWYINVTGLESGEYTFSVWGKDEDDHWGVSETRIITVKLSTTTTPTQTSTTETVTETVTVTVTETKTVTETATETVTETKTEKTTETKTITQTITKTETVTKTVTKGGNGICGPVAFLALTLLAGALFRKRRR